VVFHLLAQGLEEGGEHLPMLSCGAWLILPFTFMVSRHHGLGLNHQANVFRFAAGLQEICSSFSAKQENIRGKYFLLKSGYL